MRAPDTFETLDYTAEDVYDVNGDKITQETVDDLVKEALERFPQTDAETGGRRD
jgi:hypothetical protein